MGKTYLDVWEMKEVMQYMFHLLYKLLEGMIFNKHHFVPNSQKAFRRSTYRTAV